MLHRRNFIMLFGGAAVWPLTAVSQQNPSLPTVGFLNAASPDLFGHVASAFRVGLNQTGYIPDKNIAVEYSWAYGQYDRLPALAADLVRRGVKVIATGSNIIAAMAAKKATETVPIVFMMGADPVKGGLVTSLNRPGGNITGVTTLNFEIVSKRLELLHELLPTTAEVAVLLNPLNDLDAVETAVGQAETAARTLGMQTIQVLQASSEDDLEKAFSTFAQSGRSGLIISPDTFFSGKSAELAALALRHAVPTISPYREFVGAGGLMSYGVSITELYRLVGVYTGRILNGEKPADLPVQQATKLELLINLKTAKALGLSMPQSLLARADEVIE